MFREINKKRKLWDKYKINKTQDNYQAYMTHKIISQNKSWLRQEKNTKMVLSNPLHQKNSTNT